LVIEPMSAKYANPHVEGPLRSPGQGVIVGHDNKVTPGLGAGDLVGRIVCYPLDNVVGGRGYLMDASIEVTAQPTHPGSDQRPGPKQVNLKGRVNDQSVARPVVPVSIATLFDRAVTRRDQRA
jgi:hypothetical protein